MSQYGTPAGGTMRRSARLSSVARSVGAQSAVGVTATTSATPGRRKGALPKVNSRQSTAYGASGRRGDAEELTVPVTGFAQAFESQRGAAVVSNDEPLMSGALNGDSIPPSPSGSDDGTSSFRNDSEQEDEQDDLEDSGANTSKSFGMSREAGMLRALTPTENQQRATPRTTGRQRLPKTTPDSIVQPVRPRSAATVPISNVSAAPRRLAKAPVSVVVNGDLDQSDEGWSWQKWFMAALAAFFAFAIVMMASSGSSHGLGGTTTKGVGVAEAIWSRASYSWQGLAEWIMPEWIMPDMEDGSDDEKLWWIRLMNLDGKWEKRFEGVQDTLKRLKKDLPEQVVVIRRRDGTIDIPDDFWKALFNKANGNKSAWKEFIKKNEADLKQLLKTIDITHSQSWPMSVSQEEFLSKMEKKHKELADRVDIKIAETLKAHTKQILSVTDMRAKKAVVDHIRLQSFALTNIIANIALMQNKVNYFAPGFGARIDSSLTSPTFTDSPALIPRVYKRLMLYPERRPPTATLESWQDPGECWCSAHAKDGPGRAQVAITLPEPMFPDQITIEHIPKTAAPKENISNAPREVELWVQTDEVPHFSVPERAPHCSPGPANWQCLGKVAYDIHGANPTQTFDLEAELSIPITKTLVRVVSNWGADHTCIYRLRLHGQDDGAKHEYPVFK